MNIPRLILHLFCNGKGQLFTTPRNIELISSSTVSILEMVETEGSYDACPQIISININPLKKNNSIKA